MVAIGPVGRYVSETQLDNRFNREADRRGVMFAA